MRDFAKFWAHDLGMRFAWLGFGVALLGCEHGKGGGLVGGDCADLSLFECRTTEGCQPDVCAGCFCDLSYRGCLPSSALPTPCPALGCPSAECCGTEAECTNGASCAPPGTDQGCGACDPTPGDCVDDAGCTPGSICEPVRCSCEGATACVPGCVTNADCTTEGTVCDTSLSRCVPRPCREDAACPPSFVCDGSTCARQRCTDDLDCDGFCVLGSCFAGALGECRLPVP
jgi:hypothetical protein